MTDRRTIKITLSGEDAETFDAVVASLPVVPSPVQLVRAATRIGLRELLRRSTVGSSSVETLPRAS